MSIDQSTHPGETAADLAAVAALLEIAEEIGITPLLDRAEPFTVEDVAAAAAAPTRNCAEFVNALHAAGLVDRVGESERFLPCPDMADRRYESGYVLWAMNANRPYIENAPEFLRDPGEATRKYDRDGRWVATSSRWVGSQGFYPRAFSEIVNLRPAKVADLGAGAGGLLVHLLRTLPGSTGTAIDMSAAACEEAGRAARRAGVADRLTVVNRKIESLVEDPSPVRDADVVHAGFVMHDVVGDPETFTAVLRACREATADGCRLIVTDAVPYVPVARERAFSALFTYLHGTSMNVRLPTEEQWLDLFRRAGYTDVTSVPHRMPGGRMFVAGG
ncbi:methyltransferase type 12 [Sphaerisporangium krabiense]|uniref:SAM-dependent methyltransferase n=1 Tax=Sphaerisporangium krabiense TaxID=763782 RepID=A0A7W8Z2I3_9ACTN|nr:class I SAM-dependent methyltransferase [Sphaerisporangium krabiense]MBB5626040.1 SAM-dependent methyltransferase [Sphaerisporangium krabiense]GII64845.1 methyltransferase type 12 [Sphaerisporangium krabiense]